MLVRLLWLKPCVMKLVATFLLSMVHQKQVLMLFATRLQTMHHQCPFLVVARSSSLMRQTIYHLMHRLLFVMQSKSLQSIVRLSLLVTSKTKSLNRYTHGVQSLTLVLKQVKRLRWLVNSSNESKTFFQKNQLNMNLPLLQS